MTFISEDSPEGAVKDAEKVKQELADVFNPELAMASYIPFIRIFGKSVSCCLSDLRKQIQIIQIVQRYAMICISLD